MQMQEKITEQNRKNKTKQTKKRLNNCRSIPKWIKFHAINNPNSDSYHFFPIFSRYFVWYTCQSYIISHRNRWSGADTLCFCRPVCWFHSSHRALAWLWVLPWMYKMVCFWLQLCQFHSCYSPVSSYHSTPFQSTCDGLRIYRTSDMVLKELHWLHTRLVAKNWNAFKHIVTSVRPRPRYRNWTCLTLHSHLILLP